MKRLGAARVAEWVQIDDELSLQMRPLGFPEMRAILSQIEGLKDGAGLAEIDRLFVSAVDLVAEHVQDWTVVDDDRARLPVTRPHAEMLLGHEPHYIGLVLAAVADLFGRRLAGSFAEKKGSAPLPNGSSAGAQNTAAPVSAPATSAPRS